ncbi:MAG: hypothetical protein ACYCX2_02645 [Christensenellales bacterium]
MTMEQMFEVTKETAEREAELLTGEEIAFLVNLLSEKDDKVRYPAFLLLLARSAMADDVYPYWGVFESKLKSANSFQRNIGLLLIGENARWDREDKTACVIELYLSLLNDEKPITVRQCIAGLEKIVPYKKHLHTLIARRLMALHVYELRETMQKLVLMDILKVLSMIRNEETTCEIESYLAGALTGGILDKKSIKQLEEIL